MVNLKNKIVFVTGASSGIGAACAELFSAQGARVILTARRTERLAKIAEKLQKKYAAQVLIRELDVQNQAQVATTIAQLPADWHPIDILINNAGLARGTSSLAEGKPEDWEVVINTNVLGLLYVTRAVLPEMLERNQGHIINIGSVAGRDCYPGGNVYCATKFAVKAITKSLRMDLLGKAIRVSEIAPGIVRTEFAEVRIQNKERADAFYASLAPLLPEDIADAAVYVATRPVHVDVSEMVIYPTVQASPNHVSKK